MKINAAARLTADENYKKPTSWLWTSDGLKAKQLLAVATSVYALTKNTQTKKWASSVMSNDLMDKVSFVTIVKALSKEFRVIAKDNAADLLTYVKELK